jgi:hypothetical protein
MRPDLGRLVSTAEILQIRPPLMAGRRSRPAGRHWGRLAGRAARCYADQNYGELFMKALRLAAAMMLLASPAVAQIPKLNLLQDKPSKTQDELNAEAAEQKAYKESLKKIPDAKQPSDPWGSVRTDTPAPAKSASTTRKARTGTTAKNGSTN